jgi:hypothetical protein
MVGMFSHAVATTPAFAGVLTVACSLADSRLAASSLAAALDGARR